MFGLVCNTTSSTSLRGNSNSARSNPERILQLKTVGWVKLNNNNMDCHVAPAPRNDVQRVVLPTNQNIYPRNETQLVVEKFLLGCTQPTFHIQILWSKLHTTIFIFSVT